MFFYIETPFAVLSHGTETSKIIISQSKIYVTCLNRQSLLFIYIAVYETRDCGHRLASDKMAQGYSPLAKIRTLFVW